jgi:hypothetical protein
MLQARILSRAEFLRLLEIKGTTLDQRAFKGEIAFAFGCPIPAHTGEYLPLDALAVLLTSMLNAYAKIELKWAATAVREHWDKCLQLLQRAEREAGGEELFFAVGTTIGGKQIVEVGTAREAAKKIEAALGETGDSLVNVFFMSIQRVLRQLRANARIFKVNLPEHLTVQPDDPDYEKWRDQIENYQRLAAAKFKARAKAKKKATAG